MQATSRRHPAKTARAGFTIIELLTVITIMAILAGMILGGAAYVQRRAYESRARADMEQIKGVLTEVLLEKGSYPTNVTFIGEIQNSALGNVLTNSTMLKKAVPDLVLVDPWGRGYVYTNALRYSYELISYGPRGPTFPGDNLSNRGVGP